MRETKFPFHLLSGRCKMLAMPDQTALQASQDLDSKAAASVLLVLIANVVATLALIFIIVNLVMNGLSVFDGSGGFASIAGL